MTPVVHAISALLYDHQTVIVPGLGAFHCQAEGARVNVITNQFEKPTAILSFDPQCREDNDLIVDYLMSQDSIDEAEAKQRVMEFVSDCYAKLRSGAIVAIPEVGELSFNDNQEIVFNAVAKNDFNGDAFGLDNMRPTPIFTGNQSNWKEEVTQQIKDLNTPMTVAINHDDDHRRRGWIWILLLLIVAGGAAWWYFKYRPVEPKPEPKPIIPKDTVKVPEKDTVEIPVDTIEIPMDTIVEPEVDTVIETPIETPVEVVAPAVEKKVFIIGGCFSIEQNAMNMAEEEKTKGFTDVFVMKRGRMFYVCYGQFATVQEAKEALPRVWTVCPKAWILNKQ